MSEADPTGIQIPHGSTIVEMITVARYLDQNGESVIAYHVEHDSSWPDTIGMLETAKQLVTLRQFGIVTDE
jgi:hypothetical protein